MTHNLITVAQFKDLINASVCELDFLKNQTTRKHTDRHTLSLAFVQKCN